MKKKKLIIISMLASAFLLVSCSSDDAGYTASNRDIRFSVGWGSGSRAPITQRDVIYPGSQVWAWASMINAADNNPATNTSSYFKAWQLNALGSGYLQGVSVTRQFPAVNHLNFYAMHGDFTSGQITENTTAFPDEGLTFQVEPDQSTRDNYYLSDLVYSVYPDVEPTGIDITLPFYHMLSQIRVKLIAGDQLTTSDLAQCNVTMVNALYRGTFVPTTDADVFASQAGRASMVIADNNQRSDITLKNSTTSAFLNSNDYASAVVLPQTYAQGADMIRITLANNHEFVFRPSTALTLGSGKAYEIVITINDGHALGVITQLSDWQETSDEETINFESSIIVRDMKKILLYVFALAGMMVLSSCSSNEEEQSAGKRPIVFGSVLADVYEGRATLATNLGGSIGIMGYLYTKDSWTGTTETPNFMYKELATSANNTTWTTANGFFWPDDNTKQLRFFAYAPASAFAGSNGVFATKATQGMPRFLGYTVPTNNAEQVDLMFGESAEYLGTSTGGVTINFHHILSAISFSLSANSAGTIQSIKFKGVPYEGTYSASITGGEWTVSPVPGTGANEYSGGLSAVFLMIPQTLPSTACLEVAYTDGNSNGHTLTYSLGGITWQIGKKYDYTINIAENTITPTIVAWDTTISSEVEL